MRAIATIVLMMLAFAGQAQNLLLGEVLKTKGYSDSTGSYIVQYKYNSLAADIPATYPVGKPHYDAVITVFEINESDTTQVYQPLRGVYVDGDCICDSPAKIVTRHRNLKQAEQ